MTELSDKTHEIMKARDVLLRKVRAYQLLLNEVQNLNLGKDSTPEIKRALSYISVADYVRLGGEQGPGHLLDLQDISSCPSLSYTDRGIVRHKLVENLRTNLPPIAELGDKIRNELPDVLSKETDDIQLSSSQKEIIKLQREERECLESLVEKRQKKCVLLMGAADLKTGPQLANELKVQHAQMELLQTKAELLRMYAISEAFSSSDHSLKAHKEVDKHLDELLNSQSPKTDSIYKK